MDYFGQDNPASVYNELKELEQTILVTAQQVRSAGNEAITKKTAYEALKHQKLLELYVEESETPGLKRTELSRTVIYRTVYAAERLAWVLAEREYETEKEYLKSLLAVQISTEVRSKLLEIDRDLTRRG